MIPKDRVVIDTNVFISYLINNKTFDLLSFFINNNITIYSSEEIWTEFFSVIKKKYIQEKIPTAFYKDKTIYKDATEVITIDKTVLQILMIIFYLILRFSQNHII